MGATKGGTRRKHSDEFRAMVLEECRQSGKSIASVALNHRLNANMVRVWPQIRAGNSRPIPFGGCVTRNSRVGVTAVFACAHGRDVYARGQVRQSHTGHTASIAPRQFDSNRHMAH